MIFSAVLFGYSLQVSEYGVKKYTYQCTWKEYKSQVFIRRIDNVPAFAGVAGFGLGALYYWNIGGVFGKPAKYEVQNIAFINLSIICSAFALSLVLPKAPYSDQKNANKKARK